MTAFVSFDMILLQFLLHSIVIFSRALTISFSFSLYLSAIYDEPLTVYMYMDNTRSQRSDDVIYSIPFQMYECYACVCMCSVSLPYGVNALVRIRIDIQRKNTPLHWHTRLVSSCCCYYLLLLLLLASLA